MRLCSKKHGRLDWQNLSQATDQHSRLVRRVSAPAIKTQRMEPLTFFTAFGNVPLSNATLEFHSVPNDILLLLSNGSCSHADAADPSQDASPLDGVRFARVHAPPLERFHEMWFGLRLAGTGAAP
jgi:hypothetical protein